MSNEKTKVVQVEHNDLPIQDFKVKEVNGVIQVTAQAKDIDRLNEEQAAKVDRLVCQGLSRDVGKDALPNLASHKDKGTAMIAYGETLPVGGYHYRTGVTSRIVAHSKSDSEANVLLGALHAMEPKDAFEIDLCSQMAITNSMALTMLRKLGQADTVELIKVYENAANKLMRTYTAQMEALRKHRGKGTQTVRHVHVNDGGQAIVADTVNHGTGGKDDER